MPRKNPADHLDPSKSLTAAEMFYIEHHGDMSIAALAAELGKPTDLIKAFADDWLAKHPPVKETPRALKTMKREKGTVGMTEASSMIGDDFRGRSNINPEIVAINRALEEGRHDDARRLREAYDAKNELKRQEKIRNKYSDKIHYIIPPDDN
jgi:hypothetical protein